MFAVIYQGFIKAGMEDAYKNAWHEVAAYFVEQRGALGSRLHRTDGGLWVAYSCWPDKITRDNSWPGDNAPSSELPVAVRQAIITIQNCIDHESNQKNQIRFETCMEVVDDLLYAKNRKLLQANYSLAPYF